VKRFFITSAILGIRMILGATKRIRVFYIRGGSLIYRVLRFLGKWPLIGFYTLYLKFRFRLSHLGIEFKNPTLHVFSSKSLSLILVIIIATFTVWAHVSSHELEHDILQPKNLVARFIDPDGSEIVTENTTAPQVLEAYNPLTGLKTTPSALEEEDASALLAELYPGAISEKPGALLKPTIPTTETGLPDRSKIQNYIVQQNDTLSSIATKFNLKIITLLSANNLSLTTPLQIGQKLEILPVDGIRYRVQKGDTLSRIAQRFSINEQDILSLNNLTQDGILAIGTSLMLPGAVIPRQSPQAPREQPKTLLARLRNLFTPEKAKKSSDAQNIVGGALGKFLWPTSARRVTQYFSWRHPAVDIAGPISNKIYAADDGVIVLSGWQRGYGLTLLIDHENGKRTRYGHASKLLASAGERVEKGQVIAMVGSTGRSTGPHLHFEVFVGGRRVNPLSVIR